VGQLELIVQKEIVIVGLNHRSAPIEVRESVAFESDYLHDALTRLQRYPSIEEGVILSTCNRVEVVATVSDSNTAYQEITGGLEEIKVGNRTLHGRAYCAAFGFKAIWINRTQAPAERLPGRPAAVIGNVGEIADLLGV